MKRIKELIIVVVLLMGMGLTATSVQAAWWNVFEGGLWTAHGQGADMMYFDEEEEKH